MWLALGFLGVCLVNTVGLLLAKFLRRSGEIGVRRALGASRGQIFLQCLVEAGAVGVVGGVLGIGLALLGLYAVRQQRWDYAKLAQLDGSMLLLALGLTLLASIAAGFLPAWRAMQVTRPSSSSRSKHQNEDFPGHPPHPQHPAPAQDRSRIDRAGNRPDLRHRLQCPVPGHQRVEKISQPSGLAENEWSWSGSRHGKQTNAMARTSEDLASLRAIPGVTSVAKVNSCHSAAIRATPASRANVTRRRPTAFVSQYMVGENALSTAGPAAGRRARLPAQRVHRPGRSTENPKPDRAGR
ncbi:ftsX-like permease family domain-containing protein [Ditylenchus destructor]|uniref:FtsX-like permease family domain-containing protein n=1 Tax=Ditylenchus destructor TaxID=166010 RepID=A0AAD4QR20_9BILA|nr:ftsX-like permease family domain-containing protein [Ditylenchus destructor]